MQNKKTPILILLAFVFLTVVSPIRAQKPRTRSKPAPRPVVAQAPSFENLLSSDSYKIYVEIRNAGQLLTSDTVNELLEPVLKLAGPPKEFRTTVKWLMNHKEPIMTSRVLVATWPTARNLPDLLMAIEFDNAEEAAKFEPQLNEFLPQVLPPPAPDASPTPTTEGPFANQNTAKSTKPPEPKPTFVVKRSGSLVFVTNAPLTLKNLKPDNSKPLMEDQNFRAAHDRFVSEPVFAFLNLKAMEKEEEDRRQQSINERKREATSRRVEIAESEPKKEPEEPEEPPPPQVAPPKVESPDAVPPSPPDPMALAMTQIVGSLFAGGGESNWPEAIGFGANLDATAIDVRALLVNPPTEKTSPVPFFPLLMSGPLIVPESPNILPADTELFVTMSLDLPQVYSALTKKTPMPVGDTDAGALAASMEEAQPFAVLEKKLGIKFQTDLIPLIGNEIVLSMPVSITGVAPVTPPPTSADPNTVATDSPSSIGLNPVVAISLRDKEAMRVLLPKIVDRIAFNGASGMAQIEKREDTEIVSYANLISYAFINNFLIVSPDVKGVQHVVDSYLKHNTLASDTSFKNFTRWQPRQLQGQVYVSPVLMESFKYWATEPSALISDQTRELLSRLSVIAEPVTYSLSNEGMGPFHQLRLPKNLVLMAVAGISGEANPSPMISNERAVIGALYAIAYGQSSIRSEKGSFATLEELIAQKKVSRELIENRGYKVYLTLTGDSFEAVAVPVEYGKTGRTSYFVNETNIVRGADHGGGPATVADRPVQQ